MTPSPAGLDGVVLAGGASRRMGRDKAVIRLDGQRLVDRAVERLATVTDRVVVAAGRRSLGCDDEISDADGVAGPLAGLLAALRATEAPLVVAMPVDAPHTSPRLLLRLADLCVARERPAAVAVADGRVQALHVAVQRAALAAIEVRVAAGETSPRRLLGWLDALRVDRDGWAAVEAGTFAGDWDEPGDLPADVALWG